MDDIRENFNAGQAATQQAFEELCAMVHHLEAERESARDQANAKVRILRDRNVRLRERNARLRARYAAVVDAYNNLAEEAKERSDSSSSSDSSDGEDCVLM